MFAGLDVAMEDAFGVRRVERIGDLRGDVEHVPQLERAPGEAPIERLAVEQLHGEIELSPVLIEAVDRADVRMVQRRGGARLAAETFDRFIARRIAGRQHLQCDLAPQLRVLGAVHNPHSASAQLVEDLVVPEGLTNQRIRHGGRSILCL